VPIGPSEPSSPERPPEPSRGRIPQQRAIDAMDTADALSGRMSREDAAEAFDVRKLGHGETVAVRSCSESGGASQRNVAVDPADCRSTADRVPARARPRAFSGLPRAYDRRMKEILHFIGVSTAGSSIFELFPRWASRLGLDAEIAGRDIPLGAEPERYREAVEEIAGDDGIRGALVTAHKVDLYRHARDLFAELDSFANLCGEISCISKREHGLIGHAKDPITAGLALEHMLAPHYWSRRDSRVLCMGAGGAGTAITVYLLSADEPPAGVVVTDRDEHRISALESVHHRLAHRAEVAYHVVSAPQQHDALLAGLPPGSLAVNATGMGKDVPGSPVTGAAPFPQDGIVWELNYRGDLEFLRSAERQAAERNLAVHDGWRYFLHGWSEVIAEVFHVEVTPERFAQLATDAESLRPAHASA
jgi:shikimate dehydrogenase